MTKECLATVKMTDDESDFSYNKAQKNLMTGSLASPLQDVVCPPVPLVLSTSGQKMSVIEVKI